MPKIKKVVEELQDEMQNGSVLENVKHDFLNDGGVVDLVPEEEEAVTLTVKESTFRECICGAKIDTKVLLAGETIECECGAKHAW
jgi:hypothetical protein